MLEPAAAEALNRGVSARWANALRQVFVLQLYCNKVMALNLLF
jgi:hypothetical protein